MYNLCNVIDEQNLDTFYKIMIVAKDELPFFDHLTPEDDILAIINSIPAEFQAFTFPFMLDKHTIGSSFRSINNNTGYSNRISVPLVPQDKAIRELLETYQNKEVLAFTTRITHSYLYGTQAQPLLFTFDDLNASNKTGLKGFSLNLQGDTYGGPLYFAGKEADFPVINRGLAFQLAGSL